MSYPAEKQTKYTYSDYLKTPEDTRYELIEGDLIMVPAPKTKHQRISRKLEFILEKFVTENDSGEVFYAPCDVVFDDCNVLQPDILFISKDRLEIITEDNIKGAPDLIIEILSQSSAYADLVKKKKLYAKFKVKEYWIVDPEEKTVELYFLDNDVFKLDKCYQKKDNLTSKVLKGLEINLAEVFS